MPRLSHSFPTDPVKGHDSGGARNGWDSGGGGKGRGSSGNKGRSSSNGGNGRGSGDGDTACRTAPEGSSPRLQQLWPGSGVPMGSDFLPHQANSPQNPWGYPPGGFVNFLHQPYGPVPPQGENFQFTGLMNQNFNGTSPEPTPEEPASKQATSRKKRSTINIDDDDSVEASRAKKRWAHDEELILANAWLNSSKDPIHGSDKKGETFWMELTEKYNKNVPENRRRVSNQLQVHWSRLKTSINDFNGYFSTVSKLHTSGYSEDQLMAEAQKMYTIKHGKPFALVHWWRTLKNEPKWCAYLNKEKNKNVSMDNVDDKDLPRPMGREAAKAQLKGKRNKEEIMDGIVILGENLTKIVEMQKERKVEREKVSQTQLEISKTNLRAAKEQKEARLLEVYNSMLIQVR